MVNNQLSISEKNTQISLLEEKIKGHKFRLKEHQKQYISWSEEKGKMVSDWAYDLEQLYLLQDKPINTIAGDIIKELKSMGVARGGQATVYRSLKKDFKQENAKQLFNSIGSDFEEEEEINISVEDQINLELEVIEQKLESLPDSRKQRVLSSVSSFVKEKAPKKNKALDVGIHQAEPPESQQGESEFSKAVGLTAQWLEDAAERMRKIQSEIEIYKPEDAQQRADAWNSTINSVIIGEILHPIFMTETRAEADRKFSTSIYHWIKIIDERIKQSKHGAGKKSENYITDPLTGKPVYNKKGKPVKRGNTRERVGDFERPIVMMAEELIEANAGLVTLHDWLENVQGGHRRYRKEILHDYFSEAATGSIKSGNPEYEQWMEEYKKKQKEKYSSQ